MDAIARKFAWAVMTFLAFGVAGYAAMLLFAPGLRPPFAEQLFAEKPILTAGHFAGGALALVSGAIQMNRLIRARFPRVHRWLGRVYIAAVLVGGLAGFCLAAQAFGGLPARAGFAFLAVFWIGCTMLAYWAIRAGDRAGHRDWMIRGYALTLAAVTLRIYLPASQIWGIPFPEAYPVIAWICWVPNLCVAELIVRLRFARAPVAA